MPIEYRELIEEEFDLIPSDVLDGLKLPEGARVAGAWDGDKLAGVWCFMLVGHVHCEPLWIKPEYRKRGRIIPRLWQQIIGFVREADMGAVLSVIANDKPKTRRVAEFVGATKVNGDLYIYTLKSGKNENV